MRFLDAFPVTLIGAVLQNNAWGKHTQEYASRVIREAVLYTNHSLRMTAITQIFNSGLPEKTIVETSGHRSVKALITKTDKVTLSYNF